MVMQAWDFRHVLDAVHTFSGPLLQHHFPLMGKILTPVHTENSLVHSETCRASYKHFSMGVKISTPADHKLIEMRSDCFLPRDHYILIKSYHLHSTPFVLKLMYSSYVEKIVYVFHWLEAYGIGYQSAPPHWQHTATYLLPWLFFLNCEMKLF